MLSQQILTVLSYVLFCRFGKLASLVDGTLELHHYSSTSLDTAQHLLPLILVIPVWISDARSSRRAMTIVAKLVACLLHNKRAWSLGKIAAGSTHFDFIEEEYDLQLL
jgi:hypothetical protein